MTKYTNNDEEHNQKQSSLRNTTSNNTPLSIAKKLQADFKRLNMNLDDLISSLSGDAEFKLKDSKIVRNTLTGHLHKPNDIRHYFDTHDSKQSPSNDRNTMNEKSTNNGLSALPINQISPNASLYQQNYSSKSVKVSMIINEHQTQNCESSKNSTTSGSDNFLLLTEGGSPLRCDKLVMDDHTLTARSPSPDFDKTSSDSSPSHQLHSPENVEVNIISNQHQSKNCESLENSTESRLAKSLPRDVGDVTLKCDNIIMDDNKVATESPSPDKFAQTSSETSLSHQMYCAENVKVNTISNQLQNCENFANSTERSIDNSLLQGLGDFPLGCDNITMGNNMVSNPPSPGKFAQISPKKSLLYQIHSPENVESYMISNQHEIQKCESLANSTESSLDEKKFQEGVHQAYSRRHPNMISNQHQIQNCESSANSTESSIDISLLRAGGDIPYRCNIMDNYTVAIHSPSPDKFNTPLKESSMIRKSKSLSVSDVSHILANNDYEGNNKTMPIVENEYEDNSKLQDDFLSSLITRFDERAKKVEGDLTAIKLNSVFQNPHLSNYVFPQVNPLSPNVNRSANSKSHKLSIARSSISLGNGDAASSKSNKAEQNVDRDNIGAGKNSIQLINEPWKSKSYFNGAIEVSQVNESFLTNSSVRVSSCSYIGALKKRSTMSSCSTFKKLNNDII